MRSPQVPQQRQAPAVEGFSDSIRALSEVWQSMIWLTTTSPGLHSIRREIAGWTRNTNEAFIDTFGKATASEEIRVILDGMPGCVPQRLGDAGRLFLAQVAAEARALAAQGAEAVASVSMV